MYVRLCGVFSIEWGREKPPELSETSQGLPPLVHHGSPSAVDERNIS